MIRARGRLTMRAARTAIIVAAAAFGATAAPAQNTTNEANTAAPANEVATNAAEPANVAVANVATTTPVATETAAPEPRRHRSRAPWGLIGLVGLLGLFGRWRRAEA